MKTLLTRIFVMGLVAIMLLSAIAVVAPAESRVEYTLKKTDPSGDSEGIPTFVDQQTAQDADILEITSALSGENIVLTMKVTGLIRLSGSNYYSGYQFELDVNGDNEYDWLATATSYENYGGTKAQLQDAEMNFENFHYLDNATGNGTNTVTLTFPLSYLTDGGNITSWNIYATSSVVKDTTYSYVDEAPDEGFGEGGGGDPEPSDDTDEDGMPNDYETAYGLDPEDASDADEDKDGDGLTNYDEYLEGTDPTKSDTDGDGVSDGLDMYPLDPAKWDDDDDDVPDDTVDPSKDTPTDTGITVKIDTARFNMDRKNGKIYFDVLVKGTTSGVDHCEIGMMDVYSDGSKEFSDWMEGFDYMSDPSMKGFIQAMGFTEYHFKDTSGDNDWSSWEFRISGEVDEDDWDDDEDPTDENETEEMSKVIFYVRAYGDDAGTKWNQASKEVSMKADSDDDDDDDDDGGLPGFTAIFTLMALAITMIIAKATWRRK